MPLHGERVTASKHRGSGRQRSIVGPLAGADFRHRHVSRSPDTAVFEPDALGRRVGPALEQAEANVRLR